jgi:hypothetical protein
VLEHDAGKDCRICGGGGAEVGSAPLAQLSEQWMKALARTHGEAYRKRAATDLSQYIEPRWKDPNEITSKAWEEAKIDWHTKRTERRERLSWGSIANLANTLRAFLRYCAGLGAVESVPEIKNPSAKQLAGDRAYLRPLDSDERGAFLWALAVEGEARALRIYIALFETWMSKGSAGRDDAAVGELRAGADPDPERVHQSAAWGSGDRLDAAGGRSHPGRDGRHGGSSTRRSSEPSTTAPSSPE